MKMLTDKNENGDYVIPHIIYSDAYSSEMVAYADLILPDTTYLERHDCISPAGPPDLRGRRRRRRDPLAGGRTRPRRARLPVGAVRAGRKAGPARVCQRGRQRRNTRITPTTSPTTNAARASARWPGSAAKGRQGGRGDANPDQIDSYIENGGFWIDTFPDEARIYKPWNAPIRTGPWKWASMTRRSPTSSSFTSNRCANSSWPPKASATRQPPEHLRDRIESTMDPLPIWYPPFEDGSRPDEYPSTR